MVKSARWALVLWLSAALAPAATLGCGSSSSDDDTLASEPGNGQGSAGSGQGNPNDGDEPEAPDPLAAPDDVAEPPADAEVTESGLASRVLEAGTGTRHPSATSTVRVDYTGWQTDGTRFDSSLVRGMPSEFPLDGVIEGWTEGLQLMVEGERRRFWIPEELAYRGREGRPSGMLVFDVELIAIVSP